MNKKDLLRFALIGLASGACLAAQNYSNVDQHLAMSKCTKEESSSQQDKSMDGSSGENACGGQTDYSEDKSSKQEEMYDEDDEDEDGYCKPTNTSMNKKKTSQKLGVANAYRSKDDGRNATRQVLYGNQEPMKEKRKQCGRFFK